ncbi:class I SAM-dependent methyltransferase [Chitinophaga agrisoli]|uniref:Class I SAM-dependent methyltransferase n=1 Tax=Chitinophaga agrisoli TaxID=2607653 RepID=A0A5B2VRK5_9BACT|nr:class I SAM-dependent methyltransferase [Chitinophaga agrisoli]KAA2240779.1 class I SAM-dependent methyltransferase [Chitinophaga agrisoli]
MELKEAIALIKDGTIAPNGPVTWADLGCGSGLFTAALASMLADGSQLYAVDKQRVILNEAPFPEGVAVQPLQLDFVTNELPFQDLDGILMANSLHYVADQGGFIRQISRHMKENGRFIIVEYDTDAANRWVPYPLSYHKLLRLFHKEGFMDIQRLGERASVYGRANMYAVVVGR